MIVNQLVNRIPQIPFTFVCMVSIADNANPRSMVA